MVLNIKLYVEKGLIIIVSIVLLSACGNEIKRNDKLKPLREYEEIEKTGLASDLILDLLQRDTAGLPKKLEYKIKVSIYKPNQLVDQSDLKEISRNAKEKDRESHSKLLNIIDSLHFKMVYTLILDKELRLTGKVTEASNLVSEDIYILGHIIDDKELVIYSKNSVDIDWGVGYIQIYSHIDRASIRREFDRRLWIK